MTISANATGNRRADICVEVRNVSKTYKYGATALSDASVTIPAGGSVILVGSNAGGKTTLLKCIAGLIRIDAGDITLKLGGMTHVITARSDKLSAEMRQKIAIVFQDLALWPHLTVLQNVAAPLAETSRGYSTSEGTERAKEWLVRHLGVPLAFLSKYPYQLSGGYQRRVAIARALATEPELLLLDEITPNLDPQTVERVLSLIRTEFISNPAKTVVMVTHRSDLLRSWATSVAVIEDGSVRRALTPAEIIRGVRDGPAIVDVLTNPNHNESLAGFRILKRAVDVVTHALRGRSTVANAFQCLAEEISGLLCEMEPGTEHLALILTRNQENSQELRIRGGVVTLQFQLDGAKLHLLRDVLEPRGLATDGQPQRYTFRRPLAPDGAPFESGTNLSGSLIAAMFSPVAGTPFSFQGVEDVYHTPVPPLDDQVRARYAEFSSRTTHVYLIGIRYEGEIVSVLSIDTSSARMWSSFEVEQLRSFANVLAILAAGAGE